MTAPWIDRVDNMLGLDLETTGVDPTADRIVTATLITIATPLEPAVHEWLVNPGIDIPEAAIAVHGITTEQAQTDGLQPPEALTAIRAGLHNAMTYGGYIGPGVRSIPIVAFNAAFDLTMVLSECVRHGVEPLGTVSPVIDPYVIDRGVDQYRRGPRTLAATCSFYGVRHDDAHQIVRAWQRVGQMTCQELHDAQTGWAAEQAASFANYLRRCGEHDRAATIDGTWPIRPIRTAQKGHQQ